MKSGNSDVVVHMYLMLYSSIGDSGESLLRKFIFDCTGIEDSDLECGGFEGKGSSIQLPFYAVEVGFRQVTYDYDTLIDRLNVLFKCIKQNLHKIYKLLESGDIKSTFGVNFNCKNRNHRPAFDLRSDQMELLVKIGASVSLDSYFDF